MHTETQQMKVKASRGSRARAEWSAPNGVDSFVLFSGEMLNTSKAVVPGQAVFPICCEKMHKYARYHPPSFEQFVSDLKAEVCSMRQQIKVAKGAVSGLMFADDLVGNRERQRAQRHA